MKQEKGRTRREYVYRERITIRSICATWNYCGNCRWLIEQFLDEEYSPLGGWRRRSAITNNLPSLQRRCAPRAGGSQSRFLRNRSPRKAAQNKRRDAPRRAAACNTTIFFPYIYIFCVMRYFCPSQVYYTRREISPRAKFSLLFFFLIKINHCGLYFLLTCGYHSITKS